MARKAVYLVAAALLAGLGLLATAPAASAHATLVSSSPADGAQLGRAPARISATFDEPVGVSADSLRVFAPNGDRVDTGGTVHGSQPQEISIALLPGLGHGTYTVSWHVISDDSHPVQGAFTFSIGAPGSTSVSPATLGVHPGTLVGVAFGLVRWLAFCCFALLAGAVAFVIWCWPAGAARAGVLRLTMGAWGGLAFSVLAAVLLQGVYGAGQGIGHVFWPDVLHATEYSRYGRALGARLLLVVAALFVFTSTLDGLPGARRRARNAAGVVWGVVTAALAATWAAADHSGTGIQVPLAIPADIVHLSAMATWLGGLAVLAFIALRQPRPPGRTSERTPGGTSGRTVARRKNQAATAEAALAVVRFSPIALGCVIAIVVTGTYQAWRGVGTLGALTGTGYGRLLLLKIAAMCALIGLGYLARRRIAGGVAAAAAMAHVSPAAAAAEGRLGGKAGATAAAGRAKAGAGARSGPAKASAQPGRAKAGAAARRSNGNRTRPGTLAARAAQQGRGTVSATAQPGAAARQARRTAKATAQRPGAVEQQASGAAGNGAHADGSRVALTLNRLRWSVAAEVAIATVVLAVTAVLVNTPTGRETFAPVAKAAVVFDTGGPGGRGSADVVVTPARLGSNLVRVSIATSAGRPYHPQQVQAALSLPARHLGPLPVPLAADGPGRYVGGPVTLAMTGQWSLRIVIRSDAFDEATVDVPVSVH